MRQLTLGHNFVFLLHASFEINFITYEYSARSNSVSSSSLKCDLNFWMPLVNTIKKYLLNGSQFGISDPVVLNHLSLQVRQSWTLTQFLNEPTMQIRYSSMPIATPLVTSNTAPSCCQQHKR